MLYASQIEAQLVHTLGKHADEVGVTVELAANFRVAIGKILQPGDFIQAFASNASAITPMGSVVEFS